MASSAAFAWSPETVTCALAMSISMAAPGRLSSRAERITPAQWPQVISETWNVTPAPAGAAAVVVVSWCRWLSHMKKLLGKDWCGEKPDDGKSDRKSVGWGKSASGRVGLGGRRIIKKKKKQSK